MLNLSIPESTAKKPLQHSQKRMWARKWQVEKQKQKQGDWEGFTGTTHPLSTSDLNLLHPASKDMRRNCNRKSRGINTLWHLSSWILQWTIREEIDSLLQPLISPYFPRNIRMSSSHLHATRTNKAPSRFSILQQQHANPNSIPHLKSASRKREDFLPDYPLAEE